MSLRKIPHHSATPARLGLMAFAAALTLSACAYHGHHRGHHDGAVELELEYRDGDRDICCKRGRRDWWTHSRRDCYRDGGEVVSRRYCRRD